MPGENRPALFYLDTHTLLLDATQVQGYDPLSLQSLILQLERLCREKPWFIDVVPAMHSLTVFLADSVEPAQIAHWLQQTWQKLEPTDFKGRLIELPTCYGGEYGPDLNDVAKLNNLSCNDVIRCHSNGEYRVMFMGFQPGFAYLSGLDMRLHTPRRDVPREVIARGSVAIGGQSTGVYPADSPGGWHIIGHTAVSLFDPTHSDFCLLAPGDRIRFVVSNEVSI